MEAFIGIITLLVVVGLGLLITRIATVALVFTGLSRDLARFQARSAFTGCGFTTSESERILDHPVRRRIVMILMLMGNGTVVMAISSLIPVFMASPTSDDGLSIFGIHPLVIRLLWIVAGLLLIWALSISKWIDDKLSIVIGWALKRFTRLDVRDYHSLLHLSEGYSVTEISVAKGDWVVGKNLLQLRLTDEGMQVLGIHRKEGDYIGTPTAATYIRDGDTLLVYGRANQLAELETRRADIEGDEAHMKSVAEQRQAVEEQQRQDQREARRPKPGDEDPGDEKEAAQEPAPARRGAPIQQGE